MKFKKSITSLLVSATLFAGVTGFTAVSASASGSFHALSNSFGAITANVNFRQSPSLFGHIISVLPKNTGIYILGTSGSWTEVSYYSTVGWVYSSYVNNYHIQSPSQPQLTPSPQPSTKSSSITNWVNFRTAPELNASIYRVLSPGTSVSLLSTSASWDEVLSNGTTGWVYSAYVGSSPQSSDSVQINVPIIRQFPELGNGCEVTNLAMVLQYAGVNVDKMTLASQIAKDTTPLKRNTDGSISSWGNPNYGFVGDVTGRSIGYAVYHQPIANLMNRYLPGRVLDLTGSSFDTILSHVKTGKPVLVITNSHFVPESWGWFTYKDEYGNTVKANWDEHAVTITGYDNNYVYINNSITGQNEKWNRQNFELAWEQFGSQAITYD